MIKTFKEFMVKQLSKNAYNNICTQKTKLKNSLL